MGKQLLSDALDDYLALRSSQDLSRNTLANEKGVLKRLLTTSGNIWVHSMSERHVTRYFEQASKTRTPNTLQLDHTVLHQFFDWARKTKRLPLDMDPMAGRRRPRGRKRERDRVPVTQFERLLDAAGERDPRDRAAVAVLLYTLCRDNEAVSLRRRDVNLETGFVHMTISKSHTEDMVPICSELDTELRRWIIAYEATLGRPLERHEFLLPRRQSLGIIQGGERGRIVGHRMTYDPARPLQRIGRLMGPILTDIGFDMVDASGESLREGSHTIRRSGARALFDRLSSDGYDFSLRIVQSMLHHATVAQTERYIGVTADRRSRDEILRGKPMYAIDTANVRRLTS